jgi:hypothetical protein
MARTMTLSLHCSPCGALQPDIKVDPEDFRNWKGGELIQVAMPYLSASEREMVKTQICNACWDELMADHE